MWGTSFSTRALLFVMREFKQERQEYLHVILLVMDQKYILEDSYSNLKNYIIRLHPFV
jgi:hypothetical protein